MLHNGCSFNHASNRIMRCDLLHRNLQNNGLLHTR